MSQANTPSKKRRLGSILSLVFGIALTGVAIWVVYNKQYIVDLAAYYGYTPTTDVATIASRTKMSSTGMFYFYASQPAIESATAFNTSCERKEQSTAVLGCYSDSRIYVYNVTNTQLDGIKEVTAAHEMLHAAYQRLSTSERDRVDALLEKEYAKIKDDPNLAERMEFYAKTEPTERDNELHSIFGTEVASLDAELEAHYATYFTDRQAVVKLHDTYAAVFTQLQEKASALSAQLKTLGSTIEDESSSYNSAVKQLNTDITDFNSRASAGEFSSLSQFNSEKAALEARVSALDAQRAQITKDTTTYETLREEYNNTAASSNDLYKSIDSSLSPTPSV